MSTPLLCRIGLHRWRQISWSPFPADLWHCLRCGGYSS